MTRRAWFGAYVTASALLAALVCFVVWRQLKRENLSGQDLNRFGWERSYVERGLPVPPSGPREGYWGSRVGKKVPHPATGWHEPPVVVPTLLDIGPNGWQRVASGAADARKLTIIGGSVAFGAYASSIDRTYFHVIARELERAGSPVDVTVVAAGAWKSVQELGALRESGSELASDVVVFLDGLNDLTSGATSAALFGERVTPDGREWTTEYHAHDYEQRVADYLANMEKAADLAAELGAELVIVLQPSLAERKRLTPVEQLVLQGVLTIHSSREALTSAYDAMRKGLADLAARRGIRFLDCSRLFDGERETTFADLWHFSDRGHELLGQAIARELAPVLERRRSASAESSDGAR